MPNKNIRALVGKPLFLWSTEHATNSLAVDTVAVTSDSPEILSLAKEAGVIPILRPAELATDEARLEPALEHVLATLCITEGYMVVLPPTSPIRTPQDVTNAVALLKDFGNDSTFSVVKSHAFLWEASPDGSLSASYDWKNRPNRQKLAPTFLETGNIYACGIEGFLREHNRIYGRTAIYNMNYWTQFQIDTLEDFILCDLLLTMKPWESVEAFATNGHKSG